MLFDLLAGVSSRASDTSVRLSCDTGSFAVVLSQTSLLPFLAACTKIEPYWRAIAFTSA